MEIELTAKTIQKYSKKSIAQLLKKATEVFNRYIRDRDRDGDYFTCISCGQMKPVSKMQAGHYLSAGHNGVVRFHEDNVHGQCIRCNMHLHGNQERYRAGLIRKIGVERVEALEQLSRMSGHKWDRFGLIHLIETYKRKLS